VAQRVLGPDGGRDHGRADRRDGADLAGAARDVRGLVPRQTGGRTRAPGSPQRSTSGARLKYAVYRNSEGVAEGGPVVLLTLAPARVAKLVDAPGLGPDASDGVGVRVPPRAPATKPESPFDHGCHC